MDYEALSSQLVRALRGRRSQQGFSRRIGYAANVAYNWENGRRFPSAGAFFAAAARVRSNLEPLLEGFLGHEIDGVPVTSEAVSQLLRGLAGGLSQIELARFVAANRTTIARWLSGATQPRLPELLRWIAATTQRLLEFVSIFADPDELAATRDAHRMLSAQRQLAYEAPWTHAVLRALETRTYQRNPRHVPGVIGSLTGISLERENECLVQLSAAGQIERKRGRWIVKKVLTVDTRQDAEKNWKIKRHWAEVAIERLMKQIPHGDTLFSYNLFAISQADLQRIHELHVEYFERVRAIVADCREPERIILLNQQLVPLDE